MSYPDDFPIPEELIPVILRKLLTEPERRLLEQYREQNERRISSIARVPVTSIRPFTIASPSISEITRLDEPRSDSPTLPASNTKAQLSACIIQGFLRKALGQKTLILACDTRLAALNLQLTYRQRARETDLDLIIRNKAVLHDRRSDHLKCLSHLVGLAMGQIASRQEILDASDDQSSEAVRIERQVLLAFEAQCREYTDWICRQSLSTHRRRSQASSSTSSRRTSGQPRPRTLADELQDAEAESLPDEESHMTDSRRSLLYPAEYWYGITTNYTGARTDSCWSATP